MEEKTTMEITNDRLEEAIKDYAADRTKEKAYSSLKLASSDKTVSSGNVKSTGSANTLLFKERCRRTVFCSVHLQRADGKCTKKLGTLKHAISSMHQRCCKTGIEFKRNGHQSIYR